MTRVVFVRWLHMTTRVARTFRVAVWRRVAFAPRATSEIWSPSERTALHDAMRGME